MEWLQDFLTKDNIDGVIVGAIGGVIATITILFFGGIIRFFKWLGKFIRTSVKRLWAWGKMKIRKFKKKREYNRTINQIERKEIPVTERFLLGKSPEKNPELRKIYEMMDRGEIETPSSLTLEQVLRKNPELKEALDEVAANVKNNPPLIHHPTIKPFEPPNFKS